MKYALRRYGWLLAALLLALGGAGLWTISATHDVSLSESELQSRIDSQLPKDVALKGAAQTLLQSVSVKSANVQLRDGKAALAFDVEGWLRNGKSVEIEASALGVPKYAEGALYFAPEKIDVGRLAYQGENASELVGRLAGKLGNDKLRAALEAKAQKADDWAATAVDAALRRYLEERPVYRLKDDMKGAAMKAALEKIAIEDGRLNVTFSLWRLSASVIGGLASFILGVILCILIVRAFLKGEGIEISAC
ncbi:DUF1439 domain-containing protein [Methylocystis parvus]|uniref:DUF1439 domain-containing protein n=1 Tax=Methylocystis parvus TaxID=134 RepID=A0A6B8M7H9_9HYPH|nr:DUF1439 domain-containing protein [Methylocystis parvus]QGM98458.1 DUF1439 domain-containing protein [Methylocystis parvus]WBK01204.1 DUF1439 domain-containing protein [Methylocystis parvus OBBP]